MLKNNAKKVHLIYGIIVSVLVVALGIALVLSCIDIYKADPTGDPYSPATISAHFHDIAILVYATVAVIAGGILLGLFLPVKEERPRPVRDQRALMKKAAAKVGNPSGDNQALINKEIFFRKVIVAGCVGFFIGLMVYPAIHVFRYHDFSAPNPTTEVIKSTLIIFAPAFMGFAVCHIGAGLVSKSYGRQMNIYKEMYKNNGQKVAAEQKHASKLPVSIVRYAIFVVAVAFIVVGICNGTAADVLAKAAAICTECIGLG